MLELKTQNQNSKVKSDVRYRAYCFSIKIIHLVKSFPEKRIYWIVSDQLLRSATSVGANLVEAKSASSKKDFIKYYEIALKSANETKYWLYLLRDCRLIVLTDLTEEINEIKEISNMIGASLLTLKKKK